MTSTRGPRLIPSIGAEEGRPVPDKAKAIAERLLHAWSLVFGASVRQGAAPPFDAWSREWPRAWSQHWPRRPAFPFLPTGDVDIGWWPTGPDAFGTPDAVARLVHDKAFAVDIARTSKLSPSEVATVVTVLSPDECSEAHVNQVLASWPSWAPAAWTLKPRWGTSGRGRVAGRGTSIGSDAIRAGLTRLGRQGGAILEPWFKRSADFSSHIFVSDDGVQALGNLVQWTTPSGVCVGIEGEWQANGSRAESESADEHKLDEHKLDEVLSAMGVEAGTAAAARGYRGPLGVDAFSFGFGDEVFFRPFVEVNARFSLGFIAIGLATRAANAGQLPEGARFAVSLSGAALPDAATCLALGGDPSGLVFSSRL